MPSYWLAVASADHVRIGRKAGFMQVNHGKRGPLAKVRPGDGVVYYSPSTVYRQKDGLSALTAIGFVRPGEPYQGFMGSGFTPFRRDVAWIEAEEISIRPLLDRLDLSVGKPNWGYQLRFGLIALSEHDFRLIAETMGAKLQEVAASTL